MKSKAIYLSREEKFEVGYTIANVVKHLKKGVKGYHLEGTDMYFSEVDIKQIKDAFSKLGLAITWEQITM